MSRSASFSQVTLIIAMLVSMLGTWLAITPPHSSTEAAPATGDSLRWLHITDKSFTTLARVPIGLLTAHACALVYYQPWKQQLQLKHQLQQQQQKRSPSSSSSAAAMVLGPYGALNGIDPAHFTWSRSTALPLLLILCVGVPLRLGPYAALGQSFTFDLAQPKALVTDGPLYSLVQHPSYVGLLALLLGNALLLGRLRGGVCACWTPPAVYATLKSRRAGAGVEAALATAVLAAVVAAAAARVRDEEAMLHAAFGREWEEWHARTARFIPFVF
ncbi:hypothetical protein GGR56DRAFT_681057 [Xylariaceae sp. FL0804]|nr:hypothetical protein GGR56DRAFT_681057 [Xylariaceae sp. FL0804]